LSQQQILEIKSSLEFPSITFDEWGRQPLLPLPSLPKKRSARKSVRSQVEIEASILETCRVANVQHWIMVKARLGYDTFWKHMNTLLARGLVEERSEGSRTLYQTSAKGLEILVKLSAVEATITSL
jgi:predicted transcriptional regulator